jgi:hypothetical protein
VKGRGAISRLAVAEVVPHYSAPGERGYFACSLPGDDHPAVRGEPGYLSENRSAWAMARPPYRRSPPPPTRAQTPGGTSHAPVRPLHFPRTMPNRSRPPPSRLQPVAAGCQLGPERILGSHYVVTPRKPAKGQLPGNERHGCLAGDRRSRRRHARHD